MTDHVTQSHAHAGWWLCRLVNGRMGWAPPTFLKKKEAASYEDLDLERSTDSEGYIKVQPSCELSFECS